MKSDKKNYLIIILYGILITFLLLGLNNLYGSNTDWISQHSVIPDYFRKIFYETGNILPNLAFNIGAGQNIYNYSYYGLLSPIILLSYFLPFIKMTTYIMGSSIILHILSGLFMYYFLKENKISNKVSLILSLCFLSIGPMYHFHHHIMFVWNIPFLILSLIGVDRYINKHKSFLMMISIFLTIMTNYIYAVPALLTIVIYGIYKLLNKDNFKWSLFWLDLFLASLHVIVPILMAGILLLPSANIILTTGRGLSSNVKLSKLFIPNIVELIYKNFSMGLTGIFIISLFGLLFTKKKKRSELFLSISLIIICFIPLFMYLLNGMLYTRGKVLIPLVICFVYILAKFLEHLKNDNINIKRLIIFCFLFIGVILLLLYDKKLLLLSIDIIISIILLWLFQKYKKDSIILLPLFLIFITQIVINNSFENYVTISKYNDINNKDIISLIKEIDEDGYYRTDNYYYPLEVSNKYYQNNYFSTTLYSSNYNAYYWDFYNNSILNNINYRNIFITSGAKNYLFNKFMGVKYIVSDEELDNYELIDHKGKFKLYYNKDSYPIIYQTSNYGSIDTYEKLDDVTKVEYMLNNPVTNNNLEEKFISKLNLLDWSLDDEYEFKLDKNTNYKYILEEPIKDKILIIKFRMNYNEKCSNGDTEITINGINNKLTCRSWMYHNKNYDFEYVITDKEIKELNIDLAKGKYNISNILIYTMDYPTNNYLELDNLHIDKKNSIVTGKSNLDEDGYIITSIPFDKGFKVYVDNKLVSSEIVNLSFLGFKVSSGNHNIKITYHSPWLLLGILTSILGICGLIVMLIYDKFMAKINNIIIKNKEILLYLIFGFLTTLVSIVSYFILTKTILDPKSQILMQVANVISWILAATFAYVTNRLFVFTSKNKNIFKEAMKFYESRLTTLLFEIAFMFVFVSCLKFNDSIMKIIVQFIIVILNYILSKLIVFKGEVKK